MKFAEAKLGRVFILRLHDGDRLPYVLESFAAQKKVASGVCFLIGGAKKGSRIVVGPNDGDVAAPEAMVTLLRGVHEICGVGTVFPDEKGQPKLHMHASFGRNDNTITGCVRKGVDVWRIGEVLLLELFGAGALRMRDKATGFEFLEIE